MRADLLPRRGDLGIDETALLEMLSDVPELTKVLLVDLIISHAVASSTMRISSSVRP